MHAMIWMRKLSPSMVTLMVRMALRDDSPMKWIAPSFGGADCVGVMLHDLLSCHVEEALE